MRALIVSTLLVAACGNANKPRPGVVKNTTPPPAVDLSDPLALVPADSDLVMKIDLAALRKSPLWPKYGRYVAEMMTPGFKDCGYDPFVDISTITLGIPMGDELGVFVIRGIDRDKTIQCLKTSTIETKTSATFDGDFIMLTNVSGNANLATFVDSRTMVIQGSKGPTKESLTRALAIGAPLRANKDYLAAERKLAPNATFAMLSRPGSKRFSDGLEAKLQAPARGFATTVHFTDVVSARVTVELVDATSATEVVERITPQLVELREYVDRYDAQAQGALVTLDLVVTETQMKMFVDMAKAVMGDTDASTDSP